MSIARWIGARAAEVVAFFRDKPVVPCQVDWDRPNVQAVFKRDIYDDCDSCDKDCDCIATDTLGEFREWNQRG